MENKKKNGIYQKVEQVLESSEEARNSDATLAVGIWIRYYPQYCSWTTQGLAFLSYHIVHDLPSIETISRCRRVIQNKEKKFLPTSDIVRKQRGIKEEEYHKMVVNNMQQEFFTNIEK